MDKVGKYMWIIIAVLLAVILFLLILLVGNLEKARQPVIQEEPGTSVSTPTSEPSGPNQNDVPGSLTIGSITEQGDVVIVNTNYCQIKYPYAFSDLVQVEAINQGERSVLLFTAYLNGSKVKLYELSFGDQGGMKVGTLSFGQNAVDVHATIYEPIPGQDEGSRIAFIAAQETFNDVASSLLDNANFVPAA